MSDSQNAPPPRPPAEEAIEQEILAIRAKITELQADALQLERILTRMRAHRTHLRDANRKNSIDRILVENKIIEAIKFKKSASKIYSDVRVFFPDLKSSTFRSYIKRMKEKGLIYKSKDNKYWYALEKSDENKI